MNDDRFKFFIEQLRDGHTEKLDETFLPQLFEIDEKDLSFDDPVKVRGEVYLADEMLVLHLDIFTVATIPCIICNDAVKVAIEINRAYHTVPLNEIKGGVFNMQEMIRETVLLETPALAECHQGKCPHRKAVQKYLKKEGIRSNSKENDEGYHPFADIDFDPKKIN